MRYNVEFIRKNASRILNEFGVEKAEILVDSMIMADLSGVPTHGIKMLPAYIEKIEKGEFELGNIDVITQTSSFTKVNSKNIIGAISAMKCVDICIEKAKENGIHIVFSKNSNTLGPAFYYVEKMAEEGLVGFCCCNSPAAMPVNNGCEPMLGTNPFAFACPTKSEGIVMIDMATSVVAKSKILLRKNNGESLPCGWALDVNGNETLNPDEAIKGLILPMAGVKGYGIALMIDILSGVMSGASYLNSVGKFYSVNGSPMNVGHMFIAVDPNIVYDGDFYKEMDKYIEQIRNSKAIEGKKISIPGDRKVESRKINRKEGIELSLDTVRRLEQLFNTGLL